MTAADVSGGSATALPASQSGLDPGKEYRSRQGLPVLPALDGFRAAAIFAIVLLHLSGALINPTSAAGRVLVYGPLPNAVDVLFILSGFVVFLPTVARGGDFGPRIPYAIRRGARLLPAYWLAIAIVVLLIAVWPSTPQPAMPAFSAIGLHVVGVHTIVHMFDTGFPLGLGIDGPLWTLSIEITFYVVLAFVAKPFFRHPFIGLATAIAITILWKVGAEHLGYLVHRAGFETTPEKIRYMSNAAYGQFPAFAAQFGFGMLAAWLFVELPKRFDVTRIARAAGLVQIISGIGFLVLAYLFGRYSINNPAFAPTRARADILLALAIPLALSAFMLTTALVPAWRQLPFSLPAARSLGDISYGVYLIHLPLIFLYIALVDRLFGLTGGGALRTFWLGAPIVLALAIGYGFASGRFVEQPIRRWAHRFGARGTRGRAPAAGEPGAGEPASSSPRLSG